MKTLRYLIVITVLVLCTSLFVTGAQDNDGGIFLPTANPCHDCIEYPDGSVNLTPDGIFLPTANPCHDCIEYPTTPEAVDPCFDDDPDDLFVPLCPATATPAPSSTPRPTELALTDIVNGLWAIKEDSSTYNVVGQCRIPPGDNGGMDPHGNDWERPTYPVCMSFDNQWLSVNSSTALPLAAPNLYTTQELIRELTTDSSGATNGSVPVTIRREFRVISPTEVEVAYIREEEGGCSTSSTVRYELVEPNEIVCEGVIITPVATIEPTVIVDTTPSSVQTPGVIQPPVAPGRYIITLPTDDPMCTAENLPPSDTIELSYDDNQNAVIDFGLGSYTLFWDGMDWFEYRESNLFMVSLVTYDGGASLGWSKRVEAGGDQCYVSSQLIDPNAPVPTAVPVEPTREAYADVGSVAGVVYATTYTTSDAYCPADLVDTLTILNSATLTGQEDGTFLFELQGQSYVLTNMDGILGYTEFRDDNSMLSITMNGFYMGEGMGSYMNVDANGNFCMAQLVFKEA